MKPITRKEEYYDGMINDTPVPDPITREEHFLKDLADKIAQGGGGATSVTLAASGDNLSGDISLADLKTALSSGVVLLSFPTDGNADERVVAEYTDDSTNGLRIGVFSEDEYIVYSVVDDGSDGITLTAESTKYLLDPFVIVPTFTSQTGGTVPAGTFEKLKQCVYRGIVSVSDVSGIFGQQPGTTLTQFTLNYDAGYNVIYAYAYNLIIGTGTGMVHFFMLTVQSDESFTIKDLSISS